MDLDLKVLLEEVPPWEWPQGLEHKLLPVLRDKNRMADPEQRMAAVEIAGDFSQVNDALAGALLTLVENTEEPEDLRARAAVVFGAALEQCDLEGFGDPEAATISEKMFERVKGVLKRVYQDPAAPKLLRRRAMEGSIRAPEEWHTAEIRKAYDDGDAEWKLTAVFCMNYVRGFDKEVLESLESADPLIHREAVRAAGSFEIDAAWPHVADLARSPGTEKELRLVAIDALATLRPQDSLEILDELSGDEDEEIAEAAEEAQTMAAGFLDDDDEFDEDDEDDEDDDVFDEKPKRVN
jgi:hypothetical protein